MAINPKKPVDASEIAVKELSVPEQAAIASAKVKTRNGSTHNEKARAKRLADFNKNKA